jgi:aerobic carbon-monoxide dehydrogenase medium subunit
MKPAAFDYRAPQSLNEALAMLDAHAATAKLLAGGQSLLPVLNFRLASPALLIDLNRIPTLAGIREDADGSLVIGAMTRNRALERSELVRRANPLLHAAMPYIAHAQIRNRGTLGGSLSHADPAAELPAVCLACDARISITNKIRTRTVAAADFFTGFFSTALEPNEILTEVRFAAWPAARRAGFVELSRRHGDFALVGVALTMDLDATGRCNDARIAVFGAEDGPKLMGESAQALRGHVPDAKVIAEAARLAAARTVARADHHASAEYRTELVEVLTRRALQQALA